MAEKHRRRRRIGVLMLEMSVRLRDCCQYPGQSRPEDGGAGAFSALVHRWLTQS
jgi:hypothetical protein